MAIGWQETTDDASLATGAKRRMAQERVSCLARNDGLGRQGKKVVTRRCGIGGRGGAVLRPDQPIGEAVWSGRRTDADGDDGDLTRSAWRRSDFSPGRLTLLAGPQSASPLLRSYASGTPVITPWSAVPGRGCSPGVSARLQPPGLLPDTLPSPFCHDFDDEVGTRISHLVRQDVVGGSDQACTVP